MAANGYVGGAHPRRRHDRARAAQRRGAGRGAPTRRRCDRRRDRRARRLAGLRRRPAPTHRALLARRARDRRRPGRRVPAPRGARRRRHRDRDRRAARRSPPTTACPSTCTPTRRSTRRADGLDVLARRVLAGFDLGATASHCVSLGMQPADRQQRDRRAGRGGRHQRDRAPPHQPVPAGPRPRADAAWSHRRRGAAGGRRRTSPPGPTTCRIRSTRSAGRARSRPPV